MIKNIIAKAASKFGSEVLILNERDIKKTGGISNEILMKIFRDY